MSTPHLAPPTSRPVGYLRGSRDGPRVTGVGGTSSSRHLLEFVVRGGVLPETSDLLVGPERPEVVQDSYGSSRRCLRRGPRPTPPSTPRDSTGRRTGCDRRGPGRGGVGDETVRVGTTGVEGREALTDLSRRGTSRNIVPTFVDLV